MCLFLRFHVVFLNPSRQIPIQYFHYVTIASFKILFNSLFTNHPAIWRYNIYIYNFVDAKTWENNAHKKAFSETTGGSHVSLKMMV
jgi:hypothetical protein